MADLMRLLSKLTTFLPALLLVVLVTVAGMRPDAARPGSGSLALQPLEQVGGATDAVTAASGLVYLGVGPRLVILDPGDGSAPSMLGRSDVLPGIVQDVALAGDYVAVATAAHPVRDPDDPASAVHLIDVSDPAAPVTEGSFRAGSWPQMLAISGQRLLLLGTGAGGTGLLQVIDVSTPREPNEVGRLELGMPLALAVDGDVAYVLEMDEASGTSTLRLRILEVRPSSSPRVVNNVDLGYGFGSGALATSDGLLLVAADADEYSLRIFDVSDPAAPQVLYEGHEGSEASAALVSEGYGYLLGWDGIWVMDVRDPTAASWVGVAPIPDTFGCTMRDLAVVGGRLYVACGGLAVFALDERDMPPLTGQWAVPGDVRDVAAGAHGVFVADGLIRYLELQKMGGGYPEGLPAADIGPLRSWPVFYKLAYAAGRLYSASGSSSPDYLHVIDVTQPEAPRLASVLEPGLPTVADLAAAGHRAYAAVNATRSGGMFAVNAMDMAAPRRGGYVEVAEPPGGVSQVAAVGRYAYLVGSSSEGEGRLWTLDISQADKPRLRGSLALEGGAGSIAVLDSHVLLSGPSGPRYGSTTKASALRVVDVSDVAHPVEVSRVPMDDPGAVAAYGSFAYVADRRLIRVFDVSDPAAPIEVASYRLPDEVRNLTATSGGLYASNAEGGLYVLRLFPSDPHQVYLPLVH